MSVNPAEQLIEGKVTGEIRRTRRDLDQLKNKQRIGASSLTAQYGGTAVTGAIVIAAGTKANIVIGALGVTRQVINLAAAVYVDTDNDANFLANFGASLSAAQKKVDYGIFLNDRIPLNPLDAAFPGTTYWPMGIRNNDTVSHTVYVYVTQLYPVGTI